MRGSFLLWVGCLVAGLIAGCSFGGNDVDHCLGVDCGGHGTCVEVADEATCACDDDYVPVGLECQSAYQAVAYTLVADIHSTGDTVVDISLRHAMAADTVVDADLTVSESAAGPVFALVDGTRAVDLGAVGFHAVTAAPAAGWCSDEGASLCIGSSWQNGGTCETGFTVTANIYALELADGTYGKIEVLSGKQGRIEIRCYRQPDGSTDLTTQP